MVEPQPPPQRLVDDSGAVTLGVFAGLLPDPNLEDALPGLWGRLRLKRWQHFFCILPDLSLGLAVVHAGYLRTSWCAVVEDPRGAGRFFEHGRKSPWGDLRVAPHLLDGHTGCRFPGYEVRIHNHLEARVHQIQVEIAASQGRPAVVARLQAHHDPATLTPLEVAMPVAPGRVMYSHKVALPLEGWVRVGEKTWEAPLERSFAILDVHKAHYPRHTWWRWATFAGRDDAGRLLAMNLTCNVNTRDGEINENALWVDGRIQHLGPARFAFDPARVLDPWHIQTACGSVDLVFTPRGERCEDVNGGLVRSFFHQPWGTFRGTVRFGDQEVEVRDLVGVCEDHDALW